MTCDEVFYRQYLSGDDAGLEALMKKYGDPLTLYIDGYLHDVHEAEELMLDVFAYHAGHHDGAEKAGGLQRRPLGGQAAQILPALLYAPEDGGNHPEAAGRMAAQAPA